MGEGMGHLTTNPWRGREYRERDPMLYWNIYLLMVALNVVWLWHSAHAYSYNHHMHTFLMLTPGLSAKANVQSAAVLHLLI